MREIIRVSACGQQVLVKLFPGYGSEHKLSIDEACALSRSLHDAILKARDATTEHDREVATLRRQRQQKQRELLDIADKLKALGEAEITVIGIDIASSGDAHIEWDALRRVSLTVEEAVASLVARPA